MTKTEPFRYAVSRVDWWGVTSLLILAISAILSGWVLTALGHFIWRHWLA